MPQDSLASLSDAQPASNAPDPKTAEEMDAWEAARVKGLNQDIDERKAYAKRAFWLVVVWLAGVFALLLMQGFLGPPGWFELADAVLLAVVGGMTLNVIGIFLVVARYLFPRR